MPAPLPIEIRTRVLAASQMPGMTIAEVARLFEVGTATLTQLAACTETGPAWCAAPAQTELSAAKWSEVRGGCRAARVMTHGASQRFRPLGDTRRVALEWLPACGHAR